MPSELQLASQAMAVAIVFACFEFAKVFPMKAQVLFEIEQAFEAFVASVGSAEVFRKRKNRVRFQVVFEIRRACEAFFASVCSAGVFRRTTCFVLSLVPSGNPTATEVFEAYSAVFRSPCFC